MCTGEKRGKQMNQTELPECEKINKKEPSKDAQMTQKQAERLVEHLKNIFMYVRVLRPDEIGDFIIDEENGKLCECYAVWNKAMPCLNCISEKALREKSQKSKLECIASNVYQVIARYVEIEGEPCVIEMINRLDDETLMDSEGRQNLVSKLNSYSEELYRDALTGVFNRRYFEDQIRDASFCCGVAMIDLDDFKLYNDTYGHNAGDMALDTIVKTVNRCTRRTDRLIRLGGDEFLLVLPEMDEENFVQKLKQIQSQIHEAQVPGYSKMRLSVSVGGVLTRDETIGEAAMRADQLMYLAKQRKNMVVTEKDQILGCQDDVVRQENRREKQRILIVDDSEMNRIILSEILQDEYDIIEASTGEECLRLLEEYGTGLALILLDIVMPGMDGFGVLDYMNRNHWIEEVPVIMISSEDSTAFVRRAYEQGVSDYISRPFDAKVVYQRVFNTIKLYAKQRRLITLVTDQVYEKEENNTIMIGILSNVLGSHNSESSEHILHIRIVTEMLLRELIRKTDAYHLTEADIALIITASSLHDIGKVSIPEEILNKPGRLTDEEFKIMKSHSEIGASMIRNMEFPQDKPLVRIAWEICRWHHERWDGRGYPDGLKGEEIPISAQIVSIADVYDALTSVRCYKNAYDHDTAIQMILEGQCGQFNPLLLECLKEISPQLSRTFKKEKDDNREYYEAQRISEEILRQNALPCKDYSQRVIEIMQEKIKFFKENSGKISMEYNAISGNLVLTDGESQKEYQRDNLEFDLYGAYDISEEDIQRVKDSLDSVTSENKEISMKVMLKVRGERQMCDLKLHTLWSSLKTDGYIGIVGQLDIVK